MNTALVAVVAVVAADLKTWCVFPAVAEQLAQLGLFAYAHIKKPDYINDYGRNSCSHFLYRRRCARSILLPILPWKNLRYLCCSSSSSQYWKDNKPITAFLIVLLVVSHQRVLKCLQGRISGVFLLWNTRWDAPVLHHSLGSSIRKRHPETRGTRCCCGCR